MEKKITELLQGLGREMKESQEKMVSDMKDLIVTEVANLKKEMVEIKEEIQSSTQK